jgi:hypothetical protein
VVQGDIAGARQASKNAKMWCWIAFGTGIASSLVWLAINIGVMMTNHHSFGR